MSEQQISQKAFIDAFVKLKVFVENKRHQRRWVKLSGLKIAYKMEPPPAEIILDNHDNFKNLDSNQIK
jgi:hypothetical protein